MTDQASREPQRRRASRSTARTTTTSTTTGTTTTTSTQIHSGPGMAPLLHRAATAGRNTDTPARWWLPARNGLPAALAGGTLHPPAPAVCLLDGLPPRRLHGQGSLRAHECSLGPAGRPLTAPTARRPGETRSPGAGEEPSPTSRQK